MNTIIYIAAEAAELAGAVVSWVSYIVDRTAPYIAITIILIFLVWLTFFR